MPPRKKKVAEQVRKPSAEAERDRRAALVDR